MVVRLLRGFTVIGAAFLLAACENTAVSFSIDGAQHALILIREQAWLWDSTVKQSIVVSRLPNCQRKVTIHPGGKTMQPMEVFVAGNQLWALRQGGQWYLASTERCLVQDWINEKKEPPGPLEGTFLLKDDKPVFVPAPKGE